MLNESPCFQRLGTEERSKVSTDLAGGLDGCCVRFIKCCLNFGVGSSLLLSAVTRAYIGTDECY